MTKRIYLDKRKVSVSSDGDPTYGIGSYEAVFEVSRQAADEGPEPFGRPRAPDWKGYECHVELISGDLGWPELEQAESEAIAAYEAQ